jgi:hypothetical protein
LLNRCRNKCLKADNAVGYSLAPEGDLMFEVRGKFSARVRPRPILTSSPRLAALLRSWGWTPNGYNSLARTIARFSTIETSRFMDNRVVAKVEAPKTRCCYRGRDCSTNLDSRKGRHIKIGSKIWGTVWGTTVPEHQFFDPKMGLMGRAKFFIPSNRRWDFIRC